MRHGKSCLTFSSQNTLGNPYESSLGQILKITQATAKLRVRTEKMPYGIESPKLVLTLSTPNYMESNVMYHDFESQIRERYIFEYSLPSERYALAHSKY